MKSFYDKTDFPWFQVFEDNVEVIRDECLAVKDEFITWPEPDYHNGLWNVYGLFDYPIGSTELAHKAPRTAALIKEHVPLHGTAAFSVLRAGAEIYSHRGLVSAYTRMHLPLVVPEGELGFTVRGETRKWQYGKTWAFNDRLQHAAFNKSDQDRYILLIDFKRTPKT